MSFKESDHKRDKKGKFSVVEGGKRDANKMLKEKHPYLFGAKSDGKFYTRDEALAEARALRASGVFGSVFHLEGPRTGKKSVYTVTVPDIKKNDRSESYTSVKNTNWFETSRVSGFAKSMGAKIVSDSNGITFIFNNKSDKDRFINFCNCNKNTYAKDVSNGTNHAVSVRIS